MLIYRRSICSFNSIIFNLNFYSNIIITNVMNKLIDLKN